MKTNLGLLFLAVLFITGSCELLDEIDTGSDIRDNLTGEWKVNEDSEIFKKNLANRFYTVNITKDPVDTSLIWIDGFYELSGKVKVVVDGYNLEIPDQGIESYEIQDGSGSVSLNFKTITLYYYVDLGIGTKDVVRADYERP